VSGRPASLQGAETIVGLFINTLPVRVNVAPECMLIDWLKDIQQQILHINEYDYLLLSQVQRLNDAFQDQSLFDSQVVFENYPIDEAISQQTGDVSILDVRVSNPVHFSLALLAAPADRLKVTIMYNSRDFNTATITRMLERFRAVLRIFASGQDAPLHIIQKELDIADRELDIIAARHSTESAHQKLKQKIGKTG
jgi:non-ribosomal peptide synthetase component F